MTLAEQNAQRLADMLLKLLNKSDLTQDLNGYAIRYVKDELWNEASELLSECGL